jgi:plasmid stabilization system protein ParE
MRAHFTPQAEIDLEEVGDHIALDNPLRAVSFIDEIRQHCERSQTGRITTSHAQTWEMRYGFAPTDIT